MTDPFAQRESDRVLANESYMYLGGPIMCTAQHLYDEQERRVEWEREGEILWAQCPFCKEWTSYHEMQGLRTFCDDYVTHDDNECVFRN